MGSTTIDTLQDRLKENRDALIAAWKAGDAKAFEVIKLHRMWVSCPSDPGAPALCCAAFDDWTKGREA